MSLSDDKAPGRHAGTEGLGWDLLLPMRKRLTIGAVVLRRFSYLFRDTRRWRDPVDDTVWVGGAIFPWDVPALKQDGIGAVVSLSEEIRDPISRLGEMGIAHLFVPTRDLTPPRDEDIESALEFIDTHKRQGSRVYVHCASGIGRSVVVALAYLIRSYGLTPDEAVRRLAERRPQIALRSGQRDAVERFWKREQQRDG